MSFSLIIRDPSARRTEYALLPSLRVPKRFLYSVSTSAQGMREAITIQRLSGFKLPPKGRKNSSRSEEHTSELQSRGHLVCRLLLEKKKRTQKTNKKKKKLTRINI